MAKYDKWYAVTPAHLKKFQAYVAYWQEQLGLRSWRIIVAEHRHAPKGTLAEVYKRDLEQRTSAIALAEQFKNTEPTDLELDKLAFHECMHVLNHEIKVWAAEHGEIDHEDVTSAEHIQINVLEAFIFRGRA